MIGKRTRRIGNKNTSGNHPNYSTVKIGQNTEKSPEDLRRLASYSNSIERPSADASMKNSQGVK